MRSCSFSISDPRRRLTMQRTEAHHNGIPRSGTRTTARIRNRKRARTHGASGQFGPLVACIRAQNWKRARPNGRYQQRSHVLQKSTDSVDSGAKKNGWMLFKNISILKWYKIIKRYKIVGPLLRFFNYYGTAAAAAVRYQSSNRPLKGDFLQTSTVNLDFF